MTTTPIKVDEFLSGQLDRNYRILYQIDAPRKVHTVSAEDVFAYNFYGNDGQILNQLAQKSGLLYGNEDFSNVNIYTTGQTIVFYSGGLESSIMGLQYLGQPGDVMLLKVEGIKAFCDRFGINIIEPVLCLMGRCLGASNVVIGHDFTDTSELHRHRHVYEYSQKFVSRLARVLGITIVNPLQWIEKFYIFKQAVEHCLEFHSCSNEKEGRCGDCFKCFQQATFYRAMDFHEPFEMYSEAPVERWISEVEEYMKTGVEHYFCDNYSFKAAEKFAGKTTRQLWEE